MAALISATEKAIILQTKTGKQTIDRTFVCNDVKVHNHTFIVIGGASIETPASDRVYYPAICREDCCLYHLEYFRNNARQWKLDKPDNIRLVKSFE